MEKRVERMYRAMRDTMKTSDSRRRHGKASADLLAARQDMRNLLDRVRNGERPTEEECQRAIVMHDAALRELRTAR